MSTLKVGVIGVGGIARTHMPGWDASPHAEVIAGADLAPEALENWGNQWNVSKLETDSAAVINDPDIDIIDVCTPNMYHAPLSIAALEAGKHVICEKPLAPTPADIQAMIEARDKSGKMLMTAQHFRFAGTSKALKAEIDGGALGDIYHARSWMLRRSGIPTSLAFLSRRHAGGGACIDIGVHILDLTLWMMGNPEPVSVTGVARREIASNPMAFGRWPRHGRIPEGMDVEEMAMAFVRFETGRDPGLRNLLAAASRYRGRRHADVALWHGRRLALAEVRDLRHQLREHAAIQSQIEADAEYLRAACAGVRRVSPRRSSMARPRRCRPSSRCKC